MNRFSSIFSQLLQLFPRVEFQHLVTSTQAERHAKGFPCWDQFVSMLFCHLGRAHSLREITGGLQSCEGKLKHLGIDTAPPRSTLAYANEHRPYELYEQVFFHAGDKINAFGRPSAKQSIVIIPSVIDHNGPGVEMKLMSYLNV